MKLSLLLRYLGYSTDLEYQDFKVLGIEDDSRNVGPGFVFFAIPGFDFDGREYISSAVKAGARFVVTNKSDEYSFKCAVPVLHVDNVRLVYSFFLDAYYRNQLSGIFAITGTSGKTSVAKMAYDLNLMEGRKSACVGTLGALLNSNFSVDIDNTTPGVKKIFEIFEKCKSLQIDDVFMEASSHALSQFRIHSLNIKAAAFTNFSQDHLDYHSDMDDYFNQKKKLFSEVLPSGKGRFAILNSESDKFFELSCVARKNDNRIISYGKSDEDDFCCISSTPNGAGQEIKIKYCNEMYNVNTSLMGNFQYSNIMCSLALLLSNWGSEFNMNNMINHINLLSNIEGRMQEVCNRVIVDYAHKPDALERALKSMRWHFPGKKLILVFGCGGDRDVTKRAIMGEIASKFADLSIVTDDNPRNECAENIRKDIIKGFIKDNWIDKGDRRMAIEYAVNKVKEDQGVVLLIAGKGHEDYQITKGQKLYFSDKEVVKDLFCFMED